MDSGQSTNVIAILKSEMCLRLRDSSRPILLQQGFGVTITFTSFGPTPATAIDIEHAVLLHDSDRRYDTISVALQPIERRGVVRPCPRELPGRSGSFVKASLSAMIDHRYPEQQHSNFGALFIFNSLLDQKQNSKTFAPLRV